MLAETTNFALDVKDYTVIFSINAAATAIMLFIGELVKHYIQKSVEAKFNSELEDIKRIQNQILEEYKFDIKKREQAVKVAEFLALAIKRRTQNYSDETKLTETYIAETAKLNQTYFELCLWLPSNDVKKLKSAFTTKTGDAKDALISIRKLLNGKNDRLINDDILVF